MDTRHISSCVIFHAASLRSTEKVIIATRKTRISNGKSLPHLARIPSQVNVFTRCHSLHKTNTIPLALPASQTTLASLSLARWAKTELPKGHILPRQEGCIGSSPQTSRRPRHVSLPCAHKRELWTDTLPVDHICTGMILTHKM
jgi:hypothetical protein